MEANEKVVKFICEVSGSQVKMSMRQGTFMDCPPPLPTQPVNAQRFYQAL